MRSDLTSSDAEVRRWNRSHSHAIAPIEVSDEFKGAVVLDVTRRNATELRALLRQLHWGYGMAM